MNKLIIALGLLLTLNIIVNGQIKEGKNYMIIASHSNKATRLKNGNTLISSYPSTVIEVNKNGERVWEFSEKAIPNIQCFIFQEVSRLANGNTLICNWCPVHLKDTKEWTNTVQVLEVTPDKKVVSTLNEWNEPCDLGPASSIRLLDEPGIPEKGELQ